MFFQNFISKIFKNMMKMKPTIKTVLGMGSFNSRKKLVMTAELRMAAFLAEHNLAFLSADHMVPLLKTMFPDSEIAGDVKCSRSKVVAIVKKYSVYSLGFIECQQIFHLRRRIYRCFVVKTLKHCGQS